MTRYFFIVGLWHSASLSPGFSQCPLRRSVSGTTTGDASRLCTGGPSLRHVSGQLNRHPHVSCLAQTNADIRCGPAVVHVIAVLCALTGLLLGLLFYLHARERHILHLVDRPVTIAAVAALLSGSSLTGAGGSNGLLEPKDDSRVLDEKLAGKRFKLDPKTGAIALSDGHDEEMG